jgi:DNA gyrase subunit A
MSDLKLTEEQICELEKAFDYDSQEFDFSRITYGLRLLIQGYIDYAKEVIIARALPALDGLKPVQRRIVHTFNTSKETGLQKCSRICGNVLKFHPHGDQSVYQAMVRMVDLNGTYRIPLVAGHGAFSWVYSSEKPADRRYTEAKKHKNVDLIYGTAVDGVNYVPSFDGTSEEPELYSTTFPIILCNNSQGIAVGFSCNIPSFNPIDVLDLTIERIDNGVCTTVIPPDFVTGAFYIRNDKELLKLMKTGSGSMKLRARLEIDGKYISVKELPFGTTVQKLKKEIESLENPDVKNVSDYCDISGLTLTIECASKQKVQDLVLWLYKNSSLQCTVSANMTVIMDEKPVNLGVWGIIDEWLALRIKQLRKHFDIKMSALLSGAEQDKAVIDLVARPDVRDKMIDYTVHHSNKKAEEYIKSIFPDYSDKLVRWLIHRNNSVLRDGGEHVEGYKKALKEIESTQAILDDLQGYIRRELVALKDTFEGNYPRLTEITNQDYDFSKAEEVIRDNTRCNFIIRDGFIKKERDYGIVTATADDLVIRAGASDVLMGIDNAGRLIRIYAEHLPYASGAELGTYIPKYLGYEYDDMKIMALWRFDGKQKMLLYKDGYVSFLDTSEWLDNQRQVRIVERGVSPHSDKVFYVGDLVDNIFVSDQEGKVGWMPTATIGVKSRTARTRVFYPTKNCDLELYALLSNTDIYNFLREPSRYASGKLSYLSSLDEILDTSLLREVN